MRAFGTSFSGRRLILSDHPKIGALGGSWWFESLSVLERTRPEVAEYLTLEEVEIRERMQLTTQELHDKGDRVLLVMDGFDDVVANPGITREIWDNLRAVAARKRLRFVTGSRRPLRELCRDEDARTADFWEVFFENKIQIRYRPTNNFRLFPSEHIFGFARPF